MQHLGFRVCRWFAGVAMLLAGVVVAPPVPAQADDGYLPGQIVIKLKDTGSLPGVATQYGLNATPLDQFGTRPIYRLAITDGTDPLVKAGQLEGDSQGRVIYAEPNFEAQIPEGRQQEEWSVGGDSGTYARQYAPTTLRLSEAHRVTQGANAAGPVMVAVLDTGVDPAHPVLAGKLVPGYDFVNDDAAPFEDGSRANVGYGHGTHVSGLVALVAPAAKIMPVRVLDPNGRGNLWVLAEGLAYAADPDGNQSTDDGADVINMSLSTLRETDLLEDIVGDVVCDDDDDDDDDSECLGAAQKGVVVVLASGNRGGTTPEYPAAEAVDGSLAVAASTEANTLAAFSTRGPWVRVSAPGDRISSSVPGGGYGVWSGTSMAAPLVAGTVALYRAFDPGLKAMDVDDRIAAATVPLNGGGPARIDAAVAVGAPRGPAMPRPAPRATMAPVMTAPQSRPVLPRPAVTASGNLPTPLPAPPRR